jgi:arsenate reductase
MRCRARGTRRIPAGTRGDDGVDSSARDGYAARMARFEILHNPRCSKSRQALQRLRDAGIDPVVVDYLADPPPPARLEHILRLLGTDDPRAIMRTGEAVYRELDLAAVHDRGALLAALSAHPILIERPIVVSGDRAVIGRPPENVLTLLEPSR